MKFALQIIDADVGQCGQRFILVSQIRIIVAPEISKPDKPPSALEISFIKVIFSITANLGCQRPVVIERDWLKIIQRRPYDIPIKRFPVRMCGSKTAVMRNILIRIRKQTLVSLSPGCQFGNFATAERFVFFFCLLKLFIGNNLVRIKRKPLFYPARIPIIHIHFGKQPFPSAALFLIEVILIAAAKFKIALFYKPAGQLFAHLADNTGKLTSNIPLTGNIYMKPGTPIVGSFVPALRGGNTVIQNIQAFFPVQFRITVLL